MKLINSLLGLNDAISCFNIRNRQNNQNHYHKMINHYHKRTNHYHKRTKKFICLLTIFTTFFLLSIAQISSAKADSPATKQYNLTIENHRFKPEIIEVEANKPFELIITNRDKTVEEFESDALRKEKIISGNKTITLKIQALKPGEYDFFGEFNPKTAQGKIIAK